MHEPFETKRLGAEANSTAPDGTAVRLLPRLARREHGAFRAPGRRRVARGDASHGRGDLVRALGRGSLWRRSRDTERIEPIGPGVAVTIPLGVAFQFRAEAAAPLAFLAVTMPPWPGTDEALAVKGPWTPTVPAGR